MKFAVLGMGRTGHAMAAYLMARGCSVTVWTRDPGKRSAIKAGGITVTGEIEGHFTPAVAETVQSALAEAGYILVMTTAEGHRPLAQQMRGALRPGQRILIFNCNWGAFEFWNILGQENQNTIIAETSGMLLMSQMEAPRSCYMKAVKEHIGIAAIPNTDSGLLCTELAGVFPQFYKAGNVLETSLNVTNPIIHAAVNLFNLSAIENGQDFFMYQDAATPLAVRLAETLDAERLAVMAKMGLHGVSCKDILNQAWRSTSESLLRILKDNKSYQRAKGANGVHHRHFTEDIPYGLMPVQALGKRFQVPTPAINTVIHCFELALDLRLADQMPDLSGLRIEDFL